MSRAYVYIIRHGETQANKDHIIQGHLDTALNEVSYVLNMYFVLTWSS
jgi:broad specificity phosphatase PhoE